MTSSIQGVAVRCVVSCVVLVVGSSLVNANSESIGISTETSIWEVKIRDLEGGKEQRSPIIIIKNGSIEEEFELSALRADRYLEVYLHHLNPYPIIPAVAEVAALNRDRDRDIIRSLPRKEFTPTQSHGWARFARFDQLADSTKKFLVDSFTTLRFAVRLSLEPVTLQDGRRSYVTHSWEVSMDRLKSAELTQGIHSPKFSTWRGSIEEQWQLSLTRQNEFVVLSLHPQSQQSSGPALVQFLVHNHHGEEKIIFRSFQQDPRFSDVTQNRNQLVIKLDQLSNPAKGFMFDGNIKFGVRVSSDPVPLKDSLKEVSQPKITWKSDEHPPKSEEPTTTRELSKVDKNLLDLIHYGNVSIEKSPDGTFRLHADSIVSRTKLEETIKKLSKNTS